MLAANSETEAYLSKEYSEITKGMLEIGMDVSQVVAGPVDVTDSTIINIHWIGVIEPWKAWSLALEAVAAAKKKLNGRVKINMTMLGRGSEEAEAATLVQTLGLQDEVTLLQRVQVDELHDMVQQSDVLLFSSVKDTSGTVVLEAMSLGKAVVCLNHQGVGDMTTDETAIRVDPASISLTVDGLSNAIVKLADDF